MKKKFINAKQSAILRAIHKHGGYMTIHQIANEAGFSDVTIKKHIEDLVNWAVVFREFSVPSGGAVLTSVKKKKSKRPNEKKHVYRYSLDYALIFNEDDKEFLRIATMKKVVKDMPNGEEIISHKG